MVMNKKLPFEAECALTSLGEHLATARKRRGWRQSDLRERIGLSRTTIQKIESGDSGVSMGNYMLLIALYGAVDGIKNTCLPDDDILAFDHSASNIVRVRLKKELNNDF
ncbi:helix-turn-helix domain-containing protein [Neptunomonas antarctica]|uniref:Helix-turn-helix domain-containing protein n=1 Tax=Neptunomonas antarctica TaxID=619304 RepID=A0A1N7L5Y4_9GAMM|nr:helix-turn-helix transcriptional regulator [Neptunomonas antarctica]SIS69201.1 Helix-turn-helix domain-containing protein [Neptunomonas antarctica]